MYRTGELDPSEPVRHEAPTLEDGHDLGSALRAIREFHGVSLQDLADATRIRQSYLAALEDMRIDELPSRPFAIGYVKAYARQLGIDQDEAVQRFRQDVPDHEEGVLRAPVGVRKQRDPRLGVILALGVLIVAAIALWNVAQRGITATKPKPTTTAEAVLPPAPPTSGPLEVGEPLPAPVESTVPPPYETPGMADAAAGDGSADAADAAAKIRAAEAAKAQPAGPARPLGSPLRVQGPILGSPTGAVVVQAIKGGTFEIVRADGSFYDVEVLTAGQAYRLPMNESLSLRVTDPSNFAVYLNGGYKGALPGPSSTLKSLLTP